MSPITSHVLDTSLGKPAKGLSVVFSRRVRAVRDEAALKKYKAQFVREAWEELAVAETNVDGRLGNWLPKSFKLKAGVYSLRFNTGAYFKRRKVAGFYPEATIVFEVRDPKQHYHVPLLLNPFGYSTYRGS